MIKIYQNLGDSLFERAIKAVYDESEPEGNEVVVISPLDSRRALYAVKSPDMYGIRQEGLITELKTVSTDYVLVETTKDGGSGDPFMAIVSLPSYDVQYTYK